MSDNENEVIEQTAVDDEADTADLLTKAAELMSKAAKNKKRRGTILKEVEGVLAKLSLSDFEELEDSPIVEAFLKMMGVGDLKPGEVRNRGTLAEIRRDWSIADMAAMPHVTFIPAIGGDYTWNGVGPFRLIVGEETMVPQPIYDRYREVLFAQKQAEAHVNWLMGKTDTPPHPTWQTIEGAKVRAHSIAGRAFGVQSATLTTGRIHESTPGSAEEAPAE